MSCCCANSRIPATPPAPAAMHSTAFSALTPPSASTGFNAAISQARLSTSSPTPARPTSPSTCFSNTGPNTTRSAPAPNRSLHVLHPMARHAHNRSPPTQTKYPPHILRCQFILRRRQMNPVRPRRNSHVRPPIDQQLRTPSPLPERSPPSPLQPRPAPRPPSISRAAAHSPPPAQPTAGRRPVTSPRIAKQRRS